MATSTKKRSERKLVRKINGNGSSGKKSTAFARLGGAKAPRGAAGEKQSTGRGTAKKPSSNGAGARSRSRFSKSKDEAERKRIAAAFDAAAFDATSGSTVEQTAREWSTRY